MDRLDKLRKHLVPRLASGGLGLEIAPWHSPVLPKSEFPSMRTLDVFSQEELVARARSATPVLPEDKIAAIEPVDFTGNAARLAEAIPADLLGRFDFILSSHNFEHIPNPIRFLGDCFDLLSDDGILVMAIPDKRACFDHWRPVSTLGQVLDAHIDGRSQPSLGQQADHSLGRAFTRDIHGISTVFPFDTPDEDIWADDTRFPEFAKRLTCIGDSKDETTDNYISAHCWTFVPESFALLLRDLNALNLVHFYPMEISPVAGAEFFVHLSKVPIPYPARTQMCRALMAALNIRKIHPENDPARYRRIFTAYLAGLRLLDKLRGRH